MVKKIKKIRVLHILNELRFSGMEMMLLNSSLEWTKHNIEIAILSTGRDSGEAAEILERAGYKLTHITFVDNKWNALILLREYLRTNKYDIVHINTEANYLLYVMIAYFSGNKNIIRTFHSIFQPTHLRKMIRLVERYIAKMFNVKYISVGNSVAKNELKYFKTKSTVIYNWYDDKRYILRSPIEKDEKRKKLKLPKNKIVISVIGNCSQVKRHHLVLEALTMLPKTVDWIFLHAGKEELNYPERKIALDFDIFDNCRFLGPIQEVETILLCSDVFIMTSRVEGLGIAAIEAMACGVPVILTKVPGLNDLIDNIQEIKGVESNPLAIAKAIEDFIVMSENKKYQVKIILSRRVKNIYSMKSGTEKYSKYYKNILHSQL